MGFCSAWGPEPRPLLASKMLLFLRVASAGFCRGWFKPAEAKGEGSFSHANCGPGSWIWFFFIPFCFICLGLTGPVSPRERGFVADCHLVGRIEWESQVIFLLLHRASSRGAQGGVWLAEVIAGGQVGKRERARFDSGAKFSEQAALRSPSRPVNAVTTSSISQEPARSRSYALGWASQVASCFFQLCFF